MRPLYALLLVFSPLLAARQDFVPPLENIIAVELEFTCQRPYVATVRFYNRINEPLRGRLIRVDRPATGIAVILRLLPMMGMRGGIE